jgi:preprotein translocase subunit SecE
MEKITKVIEKAKRYIQNVRTELKRVSWPSKKELYASTVIVLITLIAISGYMWLCDSIFLKIFEKLGRHTVL